MSYHMCCHVISHVLSCHITCASLQLVFESRVTLEEAIEVYSFYSAMFEPASKYIGSKEVFAFENALQSVLDVSLKP